MKTLEYKLHANSREFIALENKTAQLIRRDLLQNRNFYVSWSGGKDSTVVLDLVRQLKPSITVMHIRSGYELPDGYAYMLRLAKDWQLNLVEINTPVDYLQLCEEFGLPHLRSKEIQKKVVSKIKKNPAKEWAIKNGYSGLFWGIRAQESIARRNLARFKGGLFLDKNNILRVSPIIDWTVKDIWAYYEFSGIPVNPIYLHENCGMNRETIRNSGWLSTDGETRGQLEWLKKNYQVQYRKIRELL